MRKKDVPIVTPKMSNVMAKPKHTSNVFDASDVKRLFSGNASIIAGAANNTGLNYGLEKATAYGSYAICQVTAPLSSRVSKTTGLPNYLKNSLIIGGTNTLSMMPHIFTRMAA